MLPTVPQAITTGIPPFPKEPFGPKWSFPSAGFGGWSGGSCAIIGVAILLGCLYLPTLAMPFDFIDDGDLVYPSRPSSTRYWAAIYWHRTLSNYRHLGPFRPTLWFHWGIEAELFNASASMWRGARLVWLMLSTCIFIWLMRELRIRKSGAILAVALAMWNPFRNEIWTSLTLSEGVAMPYALGALVCAIRAGRSRRPILWDLAGAFCILVALGCKNTFAAVVAAQLLLRIAPDGRDFRDGFRRHGFRAALLSLTLLLPIVHYLIFQSQWHPGQYEPGRPSWAQLARMLSALRGAVNLDWMAAGFFLAVLAIGGWRGLHRVWQENRAPCLAGLLLLVSGTAVYLPMNTISGRYTMPAIWGADLCIAALLGTLAGAAPGSWRRAAFAAVGSGLVTVALANVGRQEKFHARAALFWDTLHEIERIAPCDSVIAWLDGPELSIGEGIHFQWHLAGRGRKDIRVLPRDAEGQAKRRVELRQVDRPPDFLIAATGEPPTDSGWKLIREVCAPYWGGWRQYHCYVWRKEKQPSIP